MSIVWNVLQEWSSLEIEAIKELRQIVFEAIRQSYFETFSLNEEEELFQKIEGAISRLVAAIDRKKVAFEGMNLQKSLLVLPTGLGKTAVICSLPFVLPLNNSRCGL